MKFGIVRVRIFFAQLICLTIVNFVPLQLARAATDEFKFESAGARVGISGNSTSENFFQSEAFLNYNLWRWDLSPRWQLQSRIDLSAGWLGNRGYDAAIGSVGPSLLISRSELPLSLEGGFHPTFMSRDQFGSTDLGSRVQFTSHIGLNWDVTSRLRLGYRYQHMSNAGIREPNPGFNLHVFSIGYLF
jgi:hypothetical protein